MLDWTDHVQNIALLDHLEINKNDTRMLQVIFMTSFSQKEKVNKLISYLLQHIAHKSFAFKQQNFTTGRIIQNHNNKAATLH